MKDKKTIFGLWMIVYLLALAVHAVEFPDKIVLNTQQEFAPYVFYEDGKLTGISIKSLKCITERMGIALEIRVYPWKRAQELIKDGNGDGFFPASSNSERDEFAILSSEISSQKWYWYVMKKSTHKPNDQLFKERASIGVRFGTNMQQWLSAQGYNVNFLAKDWDMLPVGLLEGRFDAFLATDVTIDPILTKISQEKEFEKIFCLDMPHGVYFSKSFLKRYPDFLSRFNRYASECRNKEGIEKAIKQ